MPTSVARDRTLDSRLAALSPWALAAAALVSIAATAVVAMSQSSWIGRPFPGFFVLPNRVVASVARTTWRGARDGGLFQRLVVAADGAPVDSSADVYDAAAAGDRSIRYTLRDGATSAVVAVPSQVFSASDYWGVFGSYAATGLLYLLLGLLAVGVMPPDSGRALLAVGGIAGVYALSGAGIYAPGASLRVHALAESLFPAALLHLALVYPERWRPTAEAWAAVAWAASLALAVAYQLLLDQPASYSLLHAAAEAYLGAAGLVLAGRLTWEAARRRDAASPLLRASAVGAVVGLGIPAVVVVLSGLGGGKLPVNVVTACAFAFPLCVSLGLVRQRTAAAVA